jgi:hypothetical protein
MFLQRRVAACEQDGEEGGAFESHDGETMAAIVILFIGRGSSSRTRRNR